MTDDEAIVISLVSCLALADTAVADVSRAAYVPYANISVPRFRLAWSVEVSSVCSPHHPAADHDNVLCYVTSVPSIAKTAK